MSETTVSVLDPFSQALNRAGTILFQRFDIAKWLTLAFCAWLAFLGQATSGSATSNWQNYADPGSRRSFDGFGGWVGDNLALVLIAGALAVLLAFALLLLCVWLSSRGKFMFLDGVVHDRGAVQEPWRRFRSHGNALFAFRVVFGALAIVAMLSAVGLGWLSLYALGFDDGDMSFGILLTLVVWVFALVVLVLAIGFVSLLVNDFIVPIMWLRGGSVMDAWAELRPKLSAHVWELIGFLLLKLVLAMTIGILVCGLTCATCCLTAIPYVGTVILLPLLVFRRCYSIFFLSQLDPDYAAFGPDPATEAP